LVALLLLLIDFLELDEVERSDNFSIPNVDNAAVKTEAMNASSGFFTKFMYPAVSKPADQIKTQHLITAAIVLGCNFRRETAIQPVPKAHR